mmetsp:Transcript_7606/g.18130  ORF Transcript_7606/g.18130 Transcript_7606/m.18130 type:complete len:238 (-) Transcript_7606:3024-3737(-)
MHRLIHDLQHPGALLDAVTTGRGALAVGPPVAPSTIAQFVTFSRAASCFLCPLCRAATATTLGRSYDIAESLHLPSTLVASAPIRPLRPSAVLRLACLRAGIHLAAFCCRQVNMTWAAAVRIHGPHFPRPHSLPAATTDGARCPRLPGFHDAIDRILSTSACAYQAIAPPASFGCKDETIAEAGLCLEFDTGTAGALPQNCSCMHLLLRACTHWVLWWLHSRHLGCDHQRAIPCCVR